LDIQKALLWGQTQIQEADNQEWSFTGRNCADICKEALTQAGAGSIVPLSKNWTQITTPTEIFSYVAHVQNQLQINSFNNRLTKITITEKEHALHGLTHVKLNIKLINAQNIIHQTLLQEIGEILDEIEELIKNEKYNEAETEITKINLKISHIEKSAGSTSSTTTVSVDALENIHKIILSIQYYLPLQYSKTSNVLSKIASNAIFANINKLINIEAKNARLNNSSFLQSKYNNSPQTKIENTYSDKQIIFDSYEWPADTSFLTGKNASDLQSQKEDVRQIRQSVILNQQNSLLDNEKEYLESIQKINNALAQIYHALNGNKVNNAADLFYQGCLIKSTLLYLSEKSSQKTNHNIKSFYENSIKTLKIAYGEINKALYVENDPFSVNHKSTSNLRMLVNDNNRQSNIDSLSSFISKAFEYNQNLITSPRPPFYNWNAQNLYDEETTKQSISNILNDSNKKEGEKIKEINHLIKKNQPSMLKFWRRDEYNRYNLMKYNAELICILNAFCKGVLDETGTIAILTRLKKNHPKPEILNGIIKNLTESYKAFAKDSFQHESSKLSSPTNHTSLLSKIDNSIQGYAKICSRLPKITRKRINEIIANHNINKKQPAHTIEAAINTEIELENIASGFRRR
jgi:hypothetical protein